MEKHQRIVYFDVMRIIACSMVVLMHSPAPGANVPGYVQVPLYFMTSPGLVLFFMMSGALLLPIKGNSIQWLRHRIWKVVFPLLFWSFFYIIERLLISHDYNNLIHDILSLPFKNTGHPVLWFLYTLLGLYIVAPILSQWLIKSNRNEQLFYFLTWGITLCFPWLNKVLDIDQGYTGILYYTTGYIGYFVLGYCIHTNGLRLPTWLLFLCVIVPLFGFLLLKGMGVEGPWSLFGYLSIWVALMSLAWFEGIRRFSMKLNESSLLTSISNCCFGVYLIHIFIMRSLLWRLDFLINSVGWLGQIIITWLTTLIISLSLVWVISFLPYSEYIIGYTRRIKK